MTKEERKAYTLAWQRANRDKCRAANARHSAKKRAERHAAGVTPREPGRASAILALLKDAPNGMLLPELRNHFPEGCRRNIYSGLSYLVSRDKITRDKFKGALNRYKYNPNPQFVKTVKVKI
jgi:hypothetical protein